MSTDPRDRPPSRRPPRPGSIAEDLIEEVSIDGMCGVY